MHEHSLVPDEVYVSLEFTPNPNTLKYSINKQIVQHRVSAAFTSRAEAEKGSPLAVKLFDVPGIIGVMIGRDFVTITKDEAGDWELVHQACSTIIEEHVYHGEVVINDDAVLGVSHGSEIEEKICAFLDQEVRPAVALDGGDIVFDRYEDGIVYVHLVGACSGCPSSTATLKMGVEARLRAAIPEIREVVAV